MKIDSDFLQRAIILGPVILLSLTVHEYAHAWTAHKYGDDTAKNMGRLTLNPLAHLDFFGTVVMVLSGFRFGWAKPVPVNPANLKNPRVADIWISAAGPISNMMIAIVAGLLFRLTDTGLATQGEFLSMLLTGAVYINVALALFNLLPLFPLDGSHILRNLLPPEAAATMSRVDRVAPILLLLVIVTGLFWRILGPVLFMVAGLLLGR